MKHNLFKYWLLVLFAVMLPSLAFAQGGHKLTVTAKPAMAGTFNTNEATLVAGETIHLYAYANANFTFIRWTDDKGKEVSQQMDFTYVMPARDVTLTAEYEYNPANPANPAHNYWNKELGEVIVDDFTTGSLQNAVKNVIGDSKATDVMMITVAGVMNANDFGVVNTYSACMLLDLSRVTGVTQVPSYAFDYTKLESVYLPATIERIGQRAFYSCQQLSSLIVYAMTPPVLESNVFTGIPNGLIVYVPASAIAQYQDADGWKDFTILPIQEDIRSITVSLPDGSTATDYAKMWLELTNTKSGQRMHYVMTDKTQYTFANIIRNTSWNVVVRNERGDVFGQIENMEVKDEDVSVKFSSLSKPQSLSLQVVVGDASERCDDVTITWTDSKGNYLAQGSTLTGLCLGTTLGYRIQLSQELAMQYETPADGTLTVTDGTNVVSVRLQPIGEVTLTGKVKDLATGLALSGAVVSASQTFGGKYSKTVNAKTDSKGEYTLNIAAVPTSLAFAAADYISQTVDFTNHEFDELNEFSVPDVALKGITGATITVGFTYTTVGGETQSWYSDYQNVGFELFNVTKNRAISQYNVQYPQIVLLEEVDDGDVLRLSAYSRVTTNLTNYTNGSNLTNGTNYTNGGAFMPVTTTATIAEQKAEATFAITELGRIEAEYTQSGNANVVASLYDANGKLLKTYDYSNGQLTISNLADGQYTLVSMGSSQFFNSIYDLSQLPQTGLVQGTDYVQHTVTVKSGEVTTIIIELVPKFDESKLYYTGSGTSFTVNKPSIVAGNYLTLTGRIDFKPAYATSVSNVQMIVDLPESCQFVENSVMVGNSTSTYTLNGHQLSIPMARYTDRVRFCVIPTLGGEYAPSAFVQFDLDDQTITQPIGSANYTAKDLSISIPSTVAKTSVPVSGSAIGQSQVEIYDNGVLIGQTTSLANGTWATTCELNEPYNLSTHSIHARVTTKAGLELQSEMVNCMYDMNCIEAKSVIMSFYNGWLKKNIEVVFDFENNSTSPSSYMFYTETDITFVADLTNNDTTIVKNVNIYVYTDHNDVRKLNAMYDSRSDRWVATSKFSSMNLPINVSVDFDAITLPLVDSDRLTQIYAEVKEEQNSAVNDFATINNLINAVDEELASNDIDYNKVDSLLSQLGNNPVEIDENRVNDLVSLDTESLINEVSSFEESTDSLIAECIEFERGIEEAFRDYSFYGESDFVASDNSYYGTTTVTTCEGISEFDLQTEGYKRILTTNEDLIYEKSDENYYCRVDFTRNIRVFIEIHVQQQNLLHQYRVAIKDPEWREHVLTIADIIIQKLVSNEKILRDLFNKNDKNALEKLAKLAIKKKVINENLAAVNKQLLNYSNPVGLVGINKYNSLKEKQKSLLSQKKWLEKEEARIAKWIRRIKTLSLVLKAATQLYNWTEWYTKMKGYINEIDNFDIPYCAYLAAPEAVELVEGKIKGVRNELSDYYMRQFGRKALYNIVDAMTAPVLIGICLAIIESESERVLDEQFERYLNNDIRQINRDIIDLIKKCKKNDGNDSDEGDNPHPKPCPNTSPIHDPSGFVYEGVFSNRVEGVTATAYYKEMIEDMYGDLHENIVKWDAAEYTQENPLFTDENGFYAWDVPNGLWQVKFEKEGYETTYSEWLPVPPPQLDVNIAMKQNVQPEVKAARAYEDAVEVEFDKYMMTELLTAENIRVMQDGEAVEGSVELLNAENAVEGDHAPSETFASKVRFNAAEPFTEQEITLVVSNRVKSYAGIRMQDDYQQTFTVEQEVRNIVCDSVFSVGYGSEDMMVVQVVPAAAAAGRTLTVRSSSPMILSTDSERLSLDSEGKAVVAVRGELPGMAALTFGIEGYDLSATTMIYVNTFEKTDVNRDGATGQADINSIISMIAGCNCLPTEQADVNGDGKVDIADILTVISVMADRPRHARVGKE